MFDELTEELLDLQANVRGYGAARLRGRGGCMPLAICCCLCTTVVLCCHLCW